MKARGAKSDGRCRDRSFEASKTTTATRTATPEGSIPVTFGTLEGLRLGGGGTYNGGGSQKGFRIKVKKLKFRDIIITLSPDNGESNT